jgi:RNA polymerase sigma-54 factor
MKPSLGLRMSQHLALTPQLQQSIRLLQMSTAELEEEIEKFLEENPLLETADTGLHSSGESPSGDETADSDRSENIDESQPGAAESWSATTGRGTGDDDNDWASQRALPKSLRDVLHEQAHDLKLSDRDMAWLDVLIESLDDHGYLRESLAELEISIADVFESTFGERLDPDELQLGLKLLQSMDPPGVGARSLQDCLLLQIERLENQSLGSVDPGILGLAKRIVENDALLNALGAKEFKELCKLLHCDRDELRLAVALIQGLNPRPGKEFQQDAAETVIPDVIAYKTNTRSGVTWQVRLNESAIPRLTINPVYAEMIRDDRQHSMSSQLQEARWMIKNIQQRFDTILRVAQAIALEQQDFFEHGELAMKPLVLREIAQRCELHESTVSRVTTNKYMLTPKGTFELKYFFASHVSTDSGGTASSTAIRAKIKQWISKEDPRKPLSDQQIADRFVQDGVQVARRTIAKYREALRIDPVSQRKQL